MPKTYVLAVYGTLKKGFRNHYFLEDSEFIEKGTTKEECIVLRHDNYREINCNSNNQYEWISKDSSFPVLIFKDNTGEAHQPRKCVVELYKVRENVKKAIDILEGYPDMYDIKETEIITESGVSTNALIYHFPESKFEI